MKISFTGHRPDKLGGYDWKTNLSRPLVDALKLKLLSHPTLEYCITGMAQGFDQWAAVACLEIGIPFVAYVPFIDQDGVWPQAARGKYRTLLGKAKQVVVCNGPGFSKWKMQKRNERMVDDSNLLVACWDGTDGGTANCVKYAQKKLRVVDRLDPATMVWTTL